MNQSPVIARFLGFFIPIVNDQDGFPVVAVSVILERKFNDVSRDIRHKREGRVHFAPSVMRKAGWARLNAIIPL